MAVLEVWAVASHPQPASVHAPQLPCEEVPPADLPQPAEDGAGGQEQGSQELQGAFLAEGAEPPPAIATRLATKKEASVKQEGADAG
eukprot:12432835-Alexandrium_andersonii.AAC.1